MPVTVKDIVGIMEDWAPVRYAVPEDNPGLQAGDPSAVVRSALVAVDASSAVVDEAIGVGAQMLITHHPLIFNPLRSINTGGGEGRLLGRLITAGISLYAAHTNLDVAEGGVEDLLAAAAGLQFGDCGPGALEPFGEDALLKLVVFVPEGHEDEVRDAVCAAGAGWIGRYSDCAFMTEGTGTFKPLEGAQPFLGEVGRVERAREFRLETILPESRKSAVLRALLKAHPYEEAAFDLYPLRNMGRSGGFGRVGVLAQPVTLGGLAARMRSALGAACVKVSGDLSREIRTAATAAGSGGRNVAAAAKAGAEALVTGEIRHAQVLQAVSLGMSVVEVGHFASERAIVGAIVERLNVAFASANLCCRAIAAASEREPFTILDRDGDRCPPPARPDQSARPGVFTAFVDGGSRGNPGPAGYSVILMDPAGNKILEEGHYLGETTNNVAEYNGLIRAAEAAQAKGVRRLLVKTDSELVARQLSGEYKVKNAGLAPLFQRARMLLGGFDSWEVRHIPREENSRADGIVNRVLDEAAKAGPGA